MTEGEALEVIGHIKRYWPSSKLTHEHAVAWSEVFRENELSEVLHAVVAYRRSGSRFAPTVGEIERLVAAPAEVTGSDSEPRNIAREAHHIRHYLNAGLLPLIREHYGRVAFSFVRPEAGRYLGKRQTIRLNGILTDAFIAGPSQ